MKYLFFLLLSLVILNSSAQSNFKTAYVVTHDQDTIYGQINVKEWGTNPKIIQFKNSENSLVKYTVRHLKEFNITNEGRYIFYTGKISMGSSQFKDLTAAIDSSYRLDSVFLKVIFGGNRAILSHYRDGLKERFFITYDSTTAELLSYDYLYNSSRILNFPLYKEQLRSMSKALKLDLNVTEAELEKLKYTKENLLRFFEAVDREPKGISLTSPHSPGSRFFIAINAGSQSLRFKGDHSLSGATNSRNYILPGIELGLDIYTNPKVKKMIFRNAVSIDQRKYKISGNENEVTPGRFMLSKYNYATFDIAFKTGLVYNLFNTYKTKAFLSGGLTFNYSSVRKNEYTTKITRSFSEYELNKEPSMASLPLSKIWYGIPSEIGISYKKADLFARYTYIIKGIDRSRLIYRIESDMVGAGIRYKL